MLDHPAAQQLSSDDVEQLLLTSLAQHQDTNVWLLCQHALAAKLSPAAVCRLLAAAVQIHCSTGALNSILTLLHPDTVSADDLAPAIRTAVCYNSTTLLQTICCSMHANTPLLAAVLREALRSAVLLQGPQGLQGVWELCRKVNGALMPSPGEQQERAVAVAVSAVLCGCPAALRQRLRYIPESSPVTVWQHLLAMTLLAREQEAARMLAGECFRQQQVHEPWLPEMMRLATAFGKTGDTGECCAGVDSTTGQAPAAASRARSSAEGLLVPQLGETQQHTTVSRYQELHQGHQGLLQPLSAAQRQEKTLQHYLKLQGEEQQVFSKYCLRQVAGLMTAATSSTAAGMATAGWSSCWDGQAGSLTVVAASALQLLRSAQDSLRALPLLQAALEQMEATPTSGADHSAAVLQAGDHGQLRFRPQWWPKQTPGLAQLHPAYCVLQRASC